MSNRTLILFAHPRLEKSRTNTALLQRAAAVPGVTIHDLYEDYPNFNVDVRREQELLLGHDIIVWHHPFYWYSCPPLLKQWIDMVLAFGWAYGPGGTALKGKLIFNAITTGGAPAAYSAGGRNRFTIREFLRPFEQTALLCSMVYLPPFLIQGTHRLNQDQIEEGANRYSALIRALTTDGLRIDDLLSMDSLNDILLNSRKEI
jgi:glutathione-regulated potassium-efflux system ancillary protein KefG